MSAFRILTGVSAALALALPSLAQSPTVLLINDSFFSGPPTLDGDNQVLRLDDLSLDGDYQDSYETNILFEFAPGVSNLNYELRDTAARSEGGQAVLYVTNNRSPQGTPSSFFFPQLLRGEDTNLSGRIEPSEMVPIVSFESVLSGTSGQSARGIALHPDGSVWAATDFPGGGLLRYDNGTTEVFIDFKAGATQSLNQNGQLATVDTDDLSGDSALSWARTGVITYIDGFGSDRTEAIFKYEDLDGDGAVNDTNELTPFLVPTDINPNWAANPDFGASLRSLKLTNAMAGMPNEPAFYVARLNRVATSIEFGVETYYFATDSSAGGSFGVNENGQAVNGLIFRGQDLNLDGDVNDSGEVRLYYDGSATTSQAPLDKIIGVDFFGGSVYVHHLAGASAPSVTVLTDNNSDGDALDGGDSVAVRWDSTVLPDDPVWDAFFFAESLAVVDGSLFERPLSQDAAISGTGCSPFGPNTPRLGGLGDFKIGGGNFVAEIENGDLNRVVLLMLGSGSPSWLGIPLPVDLGLVAGLPGCFMYQDLAAYLIGVTDSVGEASFPLSVPNKPSLNGITVPMQAVVVRVSPTAILLSLTELMEATIKQ